MNFLGMLTILFIAFKLLDIIDWSWWWVLSPLCIPFLITGIIILITGIIGIIGTIVIFIYYHIIDK